MSMKNLVRIAAQHICKARYMRIAVRPRAEESGEVSGAGYL